MRPTCALLLISPWENFSALPRYSSDTTKVLSRFLKPRVPTIEEKERAHNEIMKLVEGDLPDWLQVDRLSEDGDRGTYSQGEHDTYSMFRDKLLPETWRELKKRGVVELRRHHDLDDYVSHAYFGFTLMAILRGVVPVPLNIRSPIEPTHTEAFSSN